MSVLGAIDVRVRVDPVTAVPAVQAPERARCVPHPPTVMLGVTRRTGEVDAFVAPASTQHDPAVFSRTARRNVGRIAPILLLFVRPERLYDLGDR